MIVQKSYVHLCKTKEYRRFSFKTKQKIEKFSESSKKNRNMAPHLNVFFFSRFHPLCLATSLFSYLPHALIKRWHHCSKYSSVFIRNVGKLLDFIRRCLKRLNVVCTVNCLVRKIQKQWLGRIMLLNNLYSFFYKQLRTILAPFCPDRLKERWNKPLNKQLQEELYR